MSQLGVGSGNKSQRQKRALEARGKESKAKYTREDSSGCAPESDSVPGPSLEGFKSGLWGRSQEGYRQNVHQLPRCALSGPWAPLPGQHQGRQG